MLTAEALREALAYCEDSGEFVRLKATRHNPAGSIAGARQSAGYLVIKLGGRLYLAHPACMALDDW